MAAVSSEIRYPPSWSAWSAASCASSGTRTSPSSPSVQVSRVTEAPSATYRAIVAPVLMVSSSGCACTRRRRFTSRSCRLAPRPRAAPRQPEPLRPACADPYGAHSARQSLRLSVNLYRDDLAGLGEVAGGGGALTAVDQLRPLGRADVLRLPAAGTEPTARGRIRRARHVTLEQDPVLLPAQGRLVQRNGGQQGLGVGVRRRAVDLSLGALLDHAAEVHDGDPVGEV